MGLYRLLPAAFWGSYQSKDGLGLEGIRQLSYRMEMFYRVSRKQSSSATSLPDAASTSSVAGSKVIAGNHSRVDSSSELCNHTLL